MSCIEGISAAPEEGTLRELWGGESGAAADWTGGVPNELFQLLFDI